MLKIVDVDWIADKQLTLTFNDGFQGTVDLSDCFSQAPFSAIKHFTRFSLSPQGELHWQNGDVSLSASQLRSWAQGRYIKEAAAIEVMQMEQIIKQAAWESMAEGRADILQAAIRAYVEYYGHAQVIAKAGIKSRTSAYRSLQPQTKPNFATLVQLGHAVIELAKQDIRS